MKLLFKLFVFTFIFSSHLVAQDKKTTISSTERKGDKQFFNFSYATAIGFYKDALAKDSTNSNIKLKIGDSYRMLNDPINAEEWFGSGFSEMANDNFAAPKYKLHYAQALSSNQKYSEAKIWYEKYKKTAKDDKRVSKRLKGLSNLNEFYRDSIYYDIKQVSINSPGMDFSPMWYKDGIVFVSSRTEKIFTKSVFNWDESSYLDLYYSVATDSGELAKPTPFNKKVNTKYHEGPLSFYNEEQNVVFTRNNYNQGKARQSEDGITKLKLYFAEKKGDDWGKITSFPFNNNEYSVGHPTITEDGTKMFFTSDMPGGYGSTDIYVTYLVNEEWSEPKNLGNVINTEGKEMFPYLNHGDLYFSSDGHEGLGGLDCYKAILVNDNPVSVHNLGYPVSSSYDDFSLIITEDDKYGYFSTNRDDKVYDNIYYFVYSKGAQLFMRGKVVNNYTKLILPDAIVTLKDGQGLVVEDTLSDVNGDFEFQLEYGQSYSVTADKHGYHRAAADTSVIADSNVNGIELRLEPPHHVVSILAIDKNTQERLPDADIHVMDINKNQLVEISKRESHHHEFETAGGNKYTALGIKEGYLSYSIDIFIDHDHEEYDTLFFKVPLEPIKIGKAIKLENIYYDVNKSFIRKDAAVELDKLLKILEENPTIEIELGSHTDSRGTDSYNKSLSQKRANSAVWHIVGKGINPARIKAKGYGETVLTNKCSNGVSCSKDEHQANRRTEFKVTKF